VTEGITFGNIIAIGAAIAAVIAAVYSVRTYKHNKKSEQIRIAREEMDRISAKYEKLLEVKIESLVEEEVASPLLFLTLVEEIMKECRYFGYLVYKDVIVDDDIISYYKPEITQIFVEVMSPGRDAFQKMKARSQHYPDLIKNIEAHIKLVDEFVSYWAGSVSL
jgi:hypothetical protein